MRAANLHQRAQSGDKLSAEDRAYYNRARELRALAGWLRSPSLEEPNAAFQDGPALPDPDPAGGAMVIALLLAISGIVTTGYMMTTDAYWGMEWVEDAHEILVNATLVLVEDRSQLARLEREVNEDLAKDGLVSNLVLKQSTVRAESLRTRANLEKERGGSLLGGIDFIDSIWATVALAAILLLIVFVLLPLQDA